MSYRLGYEAGVVQVSFAFRADNFCWRRSVTAICSTFVPGRIRRHHRGAAPVLAGPSRDVPDRGGPERTGPGGRRYLGLGYASCKFDEPARPSLVNLHAAAVTAEWRKADGPGAVVPRDHSDGGLETGVRNAEVYEGVYGCVTSDGS